MPILEDLRLRERANWGDIPGKPLSNLLKCGTGVRRNVTFRLRSEIQQEAQVS